MFGVGGLIVGLFLFPLVSLLIWNLQKREKVGQYLIHMLFRFFVEMMRFLGIMDYKIEGLDKLNDPQGSLVIANHPTLVDVVLLIAFMPKVDCVVKSALMRNPVMIGPIKAANYIVNSDPEALIESCSKRLRAGNSLIIFPEGTRTKPGKDLKFQRGAAGIALRANARITPVTINCEPLTLTKSNKWYQVPPRKFVITMQVKDVLDLDEIIENKEPASRAARHLTSFLQDYFTKEAAIHE